MQLRASPAARCHSALLRHQEAAYARAVRVPLRVDLGDAGVTGAGDLAALRGAGDLAFAAARPRAGLVGRSAVLGVLAGVDAPASARAARGVCGQGIHARQRVFKNRRMGTSHAAQAAAGAALICRG